MTAYFRPYFEDHWATIRMLRSTPPGRADDPFRRRVFGTALQQAEELFGAAASVGVASRPLPLFYALSQAGRAIAAAWAQDPWEIAGHGIKVRAAAGEHLRDTVVTPAPTKRRDDAFSVVSRAVGSPELSGATRLATVWASLPELPPASRLMGAATRCAGISFESLKRISGATRVATTAGLAVDGPIDEVLGRYPYVADLRREDFGSRGSPSRREVAWVDETGEPIDPRTVAVRLGDTYWLRPALYGAERPPSMLMSWWLLLLALSSVARYHPALWAEVLDVDSSSVAVPLEQALELAQQRIPELLREALLGRPPAFPGLSSHLR